MPYKLNIILRKFLCFKMDFFYCQYNFRSFILVHVYIIYSFHILLFLFCNLSVSLFIFYMPL